jgi:hypothetical protein
MGAVVDRHSFFSGIKAARRISPSSAEALKVLDWVPVALPRDDKAGPVETRPWTDPDRSKVSDGDQPAL